ncbi:MAG: hypothetical protein Q8N81_00840 [bacterium]|nr:hypothetical protein [bacterium]
MRFTSGRISAKQEYLRAKNKMSSLMATYQKKYLTLNDASVISGYTVAELRNFTKIGLVPSRKVKGKLCVRFDAFDKLNQGRQIQTPAKAVSAKRAPTSLLPFTAPSRALVKILQPMALASALVMAMYIGMMPNVAYRVVDTFDTTYQTVAFMGHSTEDLIIASDTVAVSIVSGSEGALNFTSESFTDLTAISIDQVAPIVESADGVVATFGGYTQSLIETSVNLTFAIVGEVSSIPAMSQSLAEARYVPQVAGVSTQSGLVAKRSRVKSVPENNSAERVLIAIADGADVFERFVNNVDMKASNSLINTFRFESLDYFIQRTFRL